jgi:hypothetical protein
MRVLIIFLDGVGLGTDDPAINPLAAAYTPTLWALAGGNKWLRDTPRIRSERAWFIPTDARLGVPGRPQSGSNQAAILTGRNVPAEIGEHYGPKPNAAIREILAQPENLFARVLALGKSAALLDAYPPRLFASIARGKTLRSSIQEAAVVAGVPMRGVDELRRGEAFSVDWTGEGWRTELGFADTPVYSRLEAGERFGLAASRYDFSFFSHWITDVIGHRGPLANGVAMLELFDQVMAGVLNVWDDSAGLIIITSDHGNLEDLSTRHHTENDVPTVVIGAERDAFAQDFHSLIDIAPHVLTTLARETNATN